MRNDTVSLTLDSTRRSLPMLDTSGQHWWDSIQHSFDSVHGIAGQKPQGSEIFASIIQGTVDLVLLAAWGVFFYYLIKRIRTKSLRGIASKTAIYGAWQGHNLGTTSLDPGELTEIENDLGVAPKHKK